LRRKDFFRGGVGGNTFGSKFMESKIQFEKDHNSEKIKEEDESER
jgi:hypothetical protein